MICQSTTGFETRCTHYRGSAEGERVIYAQIRKGRRLHLAYEAGEGRTPQTLVPAGFVSAPLCGRSIPNGYRMTINVPLANACKACRRVWRARESSESAPTAQPTEKS